MLIMSGSTGEFFAQVPKAVTFALIASLIECLADEEQGKHTREPAFMRPLRRWTDKFLSVVARFRFISLTVVFGAFISALFILG
ncbi:efflux RND transporter permease subunit, partial [Aduncisulcus paluster]